MVKYLSTPFVVIAAFSLLGCQPKSVEVPAAEPAPAVVPAPTALTAQDAFWNKLNLLCGKS